MSEAALQIALRTISESRTLQGPLPELAAERALDHHWRDVFEHVAIRVGPERAQQVMIHLSESCEASPLEDGGASTRVVVELYKRARRACEALLERGSEALPLSERDSLWHACDARSADALARVRHALSRATFEVAELCYARRLSIAEVADVLEIDEARAAEHASEATAIVRALFGASLASYHRTASEMLLEAFSLDPRLAPAPPRPARAPLVETGDLIAGRYEVEERIGSGAFADVYRARDRDVEAHVVALKISRTRCADEPSVNVAMRELRLLASVFHPSVVQLKDHGWHAGHLWFVMPLYRGETLAARLQRGPLGRAEAREIFVPLSEALAAIHHAGVLHQDVKPANIFLADIDPSRDEGPRAVSEGPRRVLPVLLDLGVAAKDAENVIAGTPAYLAPEVAARFAGLPDPAPVGPKADVFSLALTLRDALERDNRSEPPLSSVDAFLAHRATHAPSPPRAQQLRDLGPWFERWTNVAPDQRPTAAELCRELAALTAPAERAARRAATLRWALPTAAALFTLFGAIVFTLSREATLRRLEAVDARIVASDARQRAETMHADLTAQRALSRELEQSVQRLERDYRDSRLTRDELATRLAQAEGELHVSESRTSAARAELTAVQRERDGVLDELRAAHQKARDDHKTLLRARQRLEAQRDELAEQGTRVAHMEQRLAAVELALEHSRVQLGALRNARAAAPLTTPRR